MKKCIQVVFAMLLAGALLTTVGCTPSSGGASSAATANTDKAALQIPEFSKFNFALKNTAYTLQVREADAQWQSITPYNVRINDNLGQNIKITDPVKESPMIYFGMGDKEVEVEITKKEGGIQSAVVHPLSSGLTAEVKDGKAVLRLKEPRNVCVEINGDRYEMVYVFAAPTDTQAPAESTDTVKVIPAGLINGEQVGTNGWKGGIRDVRLYPKTLTADEIAALKNGGEVAGYSHRWALSENTDDAAGQGVAKLLGSPKFEASYQGAASGSLVFNGFEDSLETGVSISCNDPAYSVSTWVYLEEGVAATRTILNHLLMVEADGTVASYIGDWQFPYRSANKLTAGAWHHVALTKQGNNVTVYIDGESGGTQTRKEQETSAPVIIGSGTSINGIYVKDGQTLYFSPGAVFHGTVLFYGVRDAKLAGSGIIDITPTSGQVCYNGIITQYSENVTVEGVIVNNPAAFTVTTGQSKNVTYRNVKTFSSYGPSDGINTKASEDVTIDGCFIRSNDDGVSISASSVNLTGSTRRITVKNTVIINDVAHSFLIGGSGRADREDVVETIRVDNVDVIDSKQPNGGYQGVFGIGADGNGTVRDVVFNNVRVQDIFNNMLFNVYVGHDPAYSTKPGKLVEDITFSNITYTGKAPQTSAVRGYNPLCMVRNVRFDNVIINGKKLEADDGTVIVYGHTDNVTFS